MVRDLRDQIIPGNPNDPDRRGPMGPMANMRELIEKMDEGSRECIAILEGLLQEDPANVEYRLALARAERHRYIHGIRTRPAEKHRESLDRAKHILDDLVQENPTQPQFVLELADTLAYAGEANREVTQEEAKKNLEDARRYALQLSDENPNIPEYAALYCNIELRLARFSKNQRNFEEAKKRYRACKRKLDDLVLKFPSNDFYLINRITASVELSKLARENRPEPDRKEVAECVDDLLLAWQELLKHPAQGDPNQMMTTKRLFDELEAGLAFLDRRQDLRDLREQAVALLRDFRFEPRGPGN